MNNEVVEVQDLGDYLARLAYMNESANKHQRRQARAEICALRTGVGKSPGSAPRMFPIMAKFLPDPGLENPSVMAMFLIAGLFSKNSRHEWGISLGKALNRSVIRDGVDGGKHGQDGVTRRFVAALDAHTEDFPRHLENLISLCDSAEQPLDWKVLLEDTTQILKGHEGLRSQVNTRWAREYWQNYPRTAPDTSTEGIIL